MQNLPSGEVTFLFTDVEGSTVLWDQHHERMHAALTEHDRILREAIALNDGYVFSTAGDSFGAAFSSAQAAANAAAQAQLGLANAPTELQLKARIGLHTGQAEIRDANYFGIEVNRAARIMSAAHGGQVLLSKRTRDLLNTGATECFDLGEFRLKDLARPVHIFQAYQPDLENQFPRLRGVEDPGLEPPVPLTSFVGRETELIEINRLLADTRLLTLSGSGGSGKTRLAMQVAAEAHYRYPSGVRLVPLAGVSDGDVLVDEIAQTFDVHADAETPMIDSLVGAIGYRHGLLILDNCEQLVDAVRAIVIRILSGCPKMTILCTSRELLDVTGESVYRVPSLKLPNDSLTLGEALQYDAIAMFVDRAKASNHDFELTSDIVDDVAAICATLDGIPLAIELAAARVRVLSPKEIAERLDSRFLTVSAKSAAGSRHETMQQAIDWSYTLLTPAEQSLFRQVSAFTGDFAIAAVEAVCDLRESDAGDPVDVLFSLIDKSMVVPARKGGGSRYRVLTSMRNYGVARLDEAGALDDVLTRHLQYYASLGEQLQQLYRTGELGRAISELDTNEDNVRAALRYGLHRGEHELVGRLIGAIGYIWYAAGLYREGTEWCGQLIDADPDLTDETRAAVLHAYGTLLGSWAQPRVGAEMLEQEVALQRKLGEPSRLAAALNNLGNLQFDVGDAAAAEATLEEAIEVYRSIGESPAMTLASLGSGFLHAGDLEQAQTMYEDALETAAAAGNAYGVALATCHLGHCLALRGDEAGGRELLEEARTSFEDQNIRPGVAYADFTLALLDRAAGDRVSAIDRMLAALSAPEGHWYIATQYWIMQAVAPMIDDAGRAAVLLGAAAAHYDRSQERQPQFVADDLERAMAKATADASSPQELDRHLARGRRMPPQEAVALAVSTLRTLHREIGHREIGHRELGHREIGDRELGHREIGHREIGDR